MGGGTISFLTPARGPYAPRPKRSRESRSSASRREGRDDRRSPPLRGVGPPVGADQRRRALRARDSGLRDQTAELGHPGGALAVSVTLRRVGDAAGGRGTGAPPRRTVLRGRRHRRVTWTSRPPPFPAPHRGALGQTGAGIPLMGWAFSHPITSRSTRPRTSGGGPGGHRKIHSGVALVFAEGTPVSDGKTLPLQEGGFYVAVVWPAFSRSPRHRASLRNVSCRAWNDPRTPAPMPVPDRGRPSSRSRRGARGDSSESRRPGNGSGSVRERGGHAEATANGKEPSR
jgi:hypothetical protein